MKIETVPPANGAAHFSASAPRRGIVRSPVIVMAFVMMVTALTISPAAAEPSAADIQWAQQILREKGFDPGRANGAFGPKTKQALTAYQRSVGLPPTGALDQATIDHMLRNRTVAPTMGTLTAPGAPGQTLPATRSEPPPVPRAVPTTPVDRAGSATGEPVTGISRSATGGTAGGGTTGGAEPAPIASPRASVTRVTPDGAPASSGLADIALPRWAHWLPLGLVAGAGMVFFMMWLMSGRRTKRPATTARPIRREPVFETPGHGTESRPVLRAPARRGGSR